MSSIELGLLNDQSHHHLHHHHHNNNRKSNQLDSFPLNAANAATTTQSGAGAYRKKSSIHHKLSFTNLSRLNLNYSPELKNKKNHYQHPTIKKSSTYQANSDDILLSDRSLDTTNDHSKSMANEIAALGNETPRHKDTSRSILSLFFIKNKLNERNWSRRHASPSGTLTNNTNENATQKSQISLKSLLRQFFNNIGLFFIGLSVSLLTCSFLILSTFLLRKTFNIIDHDVVQTDNFTYNIEPINVTMIYMNCDFCYFAVWTTTSCFSLVYPIYFLYKLFATNCFKKKASLAEQFTLSTSVSSNSDTQQQQQQQQPQPLKLKSSSSVSQFIIMSLHFFNQNSNRKNEKIEPIKIKMFCFKIILTTLLWILTGYTFLRALDLIHFSDFIILFSVNISFTYMATWIILQRQFLPLRLVGFILAIAAIIFIYYSEGFAFNLKFLGNLFITSAAAGSAILYIVWHDVTDKKENGQRTMFITLIGVCSLLLGWPVIFILDITGVETMSLTLNKSAIDTEQKIHIVSYIVIASVFAVCYVLLLQFGHLITNQIFLQFGNFLAIPISLLIDIKVNDLVPGDLKIGAFLSISVGYLLLIIPENFYTYLKDTFWPDQPEPETNSLTRRYKQATTTNSPSPILNHL